MKSIRNTDVSSQTSPLASTSFRFVTKFSKWFYLKEIRKLLSPWQLGRERYLGASRILQTGGYDSLKRETQLSCSLPFILC